MTRWLVVGALLAAGAACPPPQPSPSPSPSASPTAPAPSPTPPSVECCTIPKPGNGWRLTALDGPIYNQAFLSNAERAVPAGSLDALTEQLLVQGLCAAHWQEDTILIRRPDATFEEYGPLDLAGYVPVAKAYKAGWEWTGPALSTCK